ncbi:MAG: hypothetical protein Q605_AUC00931G0005, partial [Actinomyces urogenitalis DORA_12]
GPSWSHSGPCEGVGVADGVGLGEGEGVEKAVVAGVEGEGAELVCGWEEQEVRAAAAPAASMSMKSRRCMGASSQGSGKGV